MIGTGDESERFVWPPGPAPKSITRESPPVEAASRAVFAPPIRRSTWLHAFERMVFGLRDDGAAGANGGRDHEAVCWRCAGRVGPGEVDLAGCSWCRTVRLGYERAVSLGTYGGTLRASIHGLKYSADRVAGRELGRALGRSIGALLETHGVEPADVVLVPVPASTRRRMLRNRGVDHALTLARAAGETSGCRVARVLARRHGPSQTSVAGSARGKNVRGVFSVRTAWEGRTLDRVMLIDDVRTTGATLTECARTIVGLLSPEHAQSGGLHRLDRSVRARIWAATAAVSEEGRRRNEAPDGGEAQFEKVRSSDA